MYYLYFLYSKKNKKHYVGTTPDLKKRFYSHNEFKNISTKSGAPWELIYYEAYSTKYDALKRETNLRLYGQAVKETQRKNYNSKIVAKCWANTLLKGSYLLSSNLIYESR